MQIAFPIQSFPMHASKRTGFRLRWKRKRLVWFSPLLWALPHFFSLSKTRGANSMQHSQHWRANVKQRCERSATNESLRFFPRKKTELSKYLKYKFVIAISHLWTLRTLQCIKQRFLESASKLRMNCNYSKTHNQRMKMWRTSRFQQI